MTRSFTIATDDHGRQVIVCECGKETVFDNGWTYFRYPQDVARKHIEHAHHEVWLNHQPSGDCVDEMMWDVRPMTRKEIDKLNQFRSKARRRRDSKRSRVYAAEHAAWEIAPSLSERVDPHREVRRVLNRKAVMRRFPTVHTVRVEINSRRMEGRAVAIGNLVSFSEETPKRGLVLHELAHVFCWYLYDDIAGHGREFRYIYSQLVRWSVGKDEYDALTTSFRDAKLSYRKPRST